MSNLSVKEAVKIAKGFVLDVLDEEQPFNVGLEEIEYSETESSWKVTIGFSRPWNTMGGALIGVVNDPAAKRDYCVVKVDDESRRPVSMTKRDVAKLDG